MLQTNQVSIYSENWNEDLLISINKKIKIGAAPVYKYKKESIQMKEEEEVVKGLKY